MTIDQAAKGIALFTPGGDLIYAREVEKGKHWHLDLCQGLQALFSLSESPHFLIPSYTATLDQWFNQQTQRLEVMGEIHPLVKRHQALLSAIFEVEASCWRVLPWEESYSDPKRIEVYREQFPELWEHHNLLVNLASLHSDQSPDKISDESTNYVLRLFVSGHSQATTDALMTLHRLLEKKLSYSYTLKVVDIMKHPEQAEYNQVAATPTLVRLYPEPVRRIVGQWDNLDRILQIIATP